MRLLFPICCFHLDFWFCPQFWENWGPITAVRGTFRTKNLQNHLQEIPLIKCFPIVSRACLNFIKCFTILFCWIFFEIFLLSFQSFLHHMSKHYKTTPNAPLIIKDIPIIWYESAMRCHGFRYLNVTKQNKQTNYIP